MKRLAASRVRPPLPGRSSYRGGLWLTFEAGKGVNIAHQADVLFVTYYTYDATGRAVWYAIPNANSRQAPGYIGSVYRGRGPAYDSPVWDASKVVLAEVGSATFGVDLYPGSATIQFKYMIEGDGKLTGLTRMSFATPASVCN